MELDIGTIKGILPHRYPFLLVDRVLRLEPFQDIHGFKNITHNEEVFNGHFPGKPIYPGVLVIEGLAQVGGLLAFISLFGVDPVVASSKLVYFMTIDGAKFRSPVIPGDRLDYHVRVKRHKGMVWQVLGMAKVGDKVVAEAELKAMIVDRDRDDRA